MDVAKVGKAIAYLRKRAGYTQNELAERIGISDKAVSKWERGLSLPDVSVLRKLSILLDTDTDSLLEGDVINHDHGWCGLLVLDENFQGINAGTAIYDKPLVYYLLSYYILVGIRTIAISCPEKDKNFVQEELDSGSELGLKIIFCDPLCINEHPIFQGFTNVMVIFGREFIYGVDQTRFFQRAMLDKDRITILSLPRKRFDAIPRIVFDDEKRIVNFEDGEKLNTQYDYYEIPVFFCPKDKIALICSGKSVCVRGDDILYTEVLDRGYVEMSIDTWEDVSTVSDFVKTVQYACGMEIYCIEEIAWRRGFISKETLKRLGDSKSKSTYGQYILSLI